MSKNNKGWAPHLVSRVEEIDIDPDIEKEIAQLQEAKLSEKIKEIKLVEEKKGSTLGRNGDLVTLLRLNLVFLVSREYFEG